MSDSKAQKNYIVLLILIDLKYLILVNLIEWLAIIYDDFIELVCYKKIDVSRTINILLELPIFFINKLTFCRHILYLHRVLLYLKFFYEMYLASIYPFRTMTMLFISDVTLNKIVNTLFNNPRLCKYFLSVI